MDQPLYARVIIVGFAIYRSFLCFSPLLCLKYDSLGTTIDQRLFQQNGSDG